MWGVFLGGWRMGVGEVEWILTYAGKEVGGMISLEPLKKE